ncbi:MAG: hypothetical protein ACRDKB_11290 [Actinomycetota bacterium]
MTFDSRADRECRRIAQEQYGVLSLEQALAAGLTKSGIRRRKQSGLWEVGLPGTLLFTTAPESWLRRVMTGVLHAGPCAVAGGRTAGGLLGLDGIPRREIEVLFVDGRRRRRPTGIIVHRTVHLEDRDVVYCAGIPTASPARTLLDLGAMVGEKTLRRAAISAIDKKLVTVSQLNDVLQRYGKPGRPGTAALRRVTRRLAGEGVLTDSELEDRVLEVIRNEGLPEPKRHYDIHVGDFRIGEVDFAYPTLKLAIEADGYEFHSSKPDFYRDRHRWNSFVAAGWRLLWFTHDDAERPRHFLQTLAALL